MRTHALPHLKSLDVKCDLPADDRAWQALTGLVTVLPPKVDKVWFGRGSWLDQTPWQEAFHDAADRLTELMAVQHPEMALKFGSPNDLTEEAIDPEEGAYSTS